MKFFPLVLVQHFSILAGISFFLQDPDGHYAKDYRMSKYATFDPIFSFFLEYIKAALNNVL